MIYLLLVVVAVLSLSRYIDLSAYMLSCDSAALSILTYSFINNNALHLLINLYAMSACYVLLKRYTKTWFIWFVIFLVPMLAGLIVWSYTSCSTLICGSSSFVYSMLGLIIVVVPYNKKARIKLIAFLVILFGIGMFLPISNSIHFFSLLLGFVSSLIFKKLSIIK